MKIIYIYYATPGLNSGYIEKLIETHQKLGHNCLYLVNSAFGYKRPISSGVIGMFFLLTERFINGRIFLTNPTLGLIRKAIRYAELCAGLFVAVAICAFCRPSYVNFAITESYRVNKLAVYLLRLVAKTLIITFHDIVPHTGKQDLVRYGIAKSASQILVHNNRAKTLFSSEFPQFSGKLLEHIYPWSETPPHVGQGPQLLGPCNKKRFLFIGYIRYTKGLDMLLDAWTMVFGDRRDVELSVYGQPDMDCSGIARKYGNIPNLFLNFGKISDSGFLECISRSHIVCLPYRDSYAHSAVHYVSYLWCSRCVIATRVGPFLDDLSDDFAFLCEPNVVDISAGLKRVDVTSTSDLLTMGDRGRLVFTRRQSRLKNEVKNIYRG
jgi:glycosyltransferase involved in cell wall biosynthesis